ncbi:MAG: Fe(3+) dicitrate transport protein FecA precursor [Elusimicrobia bacterium ADurb.Bin231]|nr:MAG: Fe(3+) dicitrate transport protein FecA precursor [Elusimicrobia bacterium ADurb.Bin231]
MKINIVFLSFAFMICAEISAETGSYIGNLGDLGETSVYVGVHKESKKESPAVVVNEISGEKLKKSGVQTVADALERVAGVDTRNSGKGLNSISVRGFDQQSMKVLIDGVPAYESYFGLVDLSVMPVASIEKIVVSKGSSSILYGPNTMGGVVNIITKKGSGAPQTSLVTSFGDFNTFNYGLNQSGKLGKFNYNVGYNKQTADGWGLSRDFDKTNVNTGIATDYKEDGGKRENSDYIKQSFVCNIGYTPDETLKTNLSVNWLNQEKGCPISNLMGSAHKVKFSNWSQWQASVAMEKNFSPSAALKGRIFYINHEDELTVDTMTTVSMGGRPYFDKSVYKDYSFGVESNFYLNILEDNLTKIGFTYQKDSHNGQDYNAWIWKKVAGVWNSTITPGWSAESISEADTYSIGLENSLMSMDDKLTLNFGCGYNGYVPLKSAGVPHPDDTWIFTPQIGADYEVADNTTLYGSIGKKVRFPRMKELYSKIAGGNPDIEAERSISQELGIRQGIGDVKIYCSYFDNNISKMIYSQKDASKNTYYVNIGKARIYGAESGIEAPLTSNLSILGDYTYLYAYDKTNSHEIAQKPRHKFNLAVDYSFGFGLSAYMQGVYVGQQKLDSPARNICEYTLFNAKLSQNLSSGESGSQQIFISVNNLFDKDYEEGDGPMAGRSFLAGVEYVF